MLCLTVSSIGWGEEYAQGLGRNAPKVAAELLRIALHGEKESDRVAACRAYLDRAWGVMQSFGDDDAKKTTIRVVFVKPNPKPLPPLDQLQLQQANNSPAPRRRRLYR
jgi:hypothetical protein